MKTPEPTRAQILKSIRHHLDMVKQWTRHALEFGGSKPSAAVYGFERCLEYSYKAEGLIELLEVNDCGSVGGYDNGHTGTKDLEKRYLWLLEKEAPSRTTH